MRQSSTFLLHFEINKVFWSPILQNLNVKSILDNLFFENYSLYRPKKMPDQEKNVYFSRKMVENAEL